MLIRFKLKKAGDIHCLLRSSALARRLTKSRGSFRKKLAEQLAKKGGDFELWLALCELAEFAESLWAAPVTVEAEV